MTGRPEDNISRDHYLDRVVEVGEQAGLVTSEPVTARNGIVLVGTGTAVTSALRERLLRHKLLRPIDESLTAEQPVTVEVLATRARSLLTALTLPARLAKRVTDSSRLISVIRSVDLPRPLEIKLTVAAATDPERLDHLLTVTLTAVAIGLRRGMPAADLKALATAGLLHDLGELHIDPAIFRDTGGLSVDMRRQVEAHPVIMHAILEAFGPRYQDAARAILEHHERVDGSGYPRGLESEQLSLSGRILALAEFVASLRARRECPHTLVALKLQRHHFDPALAATLFELLGPTGQPASGDGMPITRLTERLTQSQAQLENWFDLTAKADATALPRDEAQWLRQRSLAIDRHFARLGLDRGDLKHSLAPIADDTEAIAELGIIVEEIDRQIRDTAWEAHRRLRRTRSVEALSERTRNGLFGVLTSRHATPDH